jgi:hypothetical protein
MNASQRGVALGLALALATWATGCTAGQESSEPRRTPTASATSSHSATSEPKAEPTPAGAKDLLTATRMTPPFRTGGVPYAVRAGDGTKIVMWEPTRASTAYRLYDRSWRPRTPLLSVPVDLHAWRGTTGGFLGQAWAYRRDGSVVIDKWVRINRAGRVSAVAHQPSRSAPAEAPRPGDVLVRGYGFNGTAASFSYRPGADAILRRTRLPGPAVGAGRDVPEDFRSVNGGWICALRPGRLSDGRVHVSTDQGRTFTDLAVAGLIPSWSGPQIEACDSTADRILVTTGADGADWLHTLDRTGEYLISSQPLGTGLNPYAWGMLPDGRLVAGTNRPGLMVATDSTNTLMEYRPGPVPVGWGAQIVGDELLVIRGGTVQVSKDAGLTWQAIDLQLP